MYLRLGSTMSLDMLFCILSCTLLANWHGVTCAQPWHAAMIRSAPGVSPQKLYHVQVTVTDVHFALQCSLWVLITEPLYRS